MKNINKVIVALAAVFICFAVFKLRQQSVFSNQNIHISPPRASHFITLGPEDKELEKFNQEITSRYGDKQYTFTSDIKMMLTDDKGKPVEIAGKDYFLKGKGAYVFDMKNQNFRKEENLVDIKGEPLTDIMIEKNGEKYRLIPYDKQGAFALHTRFSGEKYQGYTNIITDNIDGPSVSQVELNYQLVVHKVKENKKDYYEIKMYSQGDYDNIYTYHSKTLYDAETFMPYKSSEIMYSSHYDPEGLIETTYTPLQASNSYEAFELNLPKNMQPFDTTLLKLESFDIEPECGHWEHVCSKDNHVWNVIPEVYMKNNKRIPGTGSFYRTYGTYFPDLDFKLYESSVGYSEDKDARRALPSSISWQEVKKLNAYQFEMSKKDNKDYTNVRLDVYDKKTHKKLGEVHEVRWDFSGHWNMELRGFKKVSTDDSAFISNDQKVEANVFISSKISKNVDKCETVKIKESTAYVCPMIGNKTSPWSEIHMLYKQYTIQLTRTPFQCIEAYETAEFAPCLNRTVSKEEALKYLETAVEALK